MTQFQVGQRVRVKQGTVAYGGYSATVTRVSGGLLHLDDLDRSPPSGYVPNPCLFARDVELINDLTPAPPAVKQNQRTQPDLAAFFKGPSNYAQCPNCRTGKLVPMFSGQALCDQACERSPRAGGYGIGAKTYWASWCDTDTNSKGSHCCIWDSKDSAEWWVRGIPACRVTQVSWLGSASPDFVDYDHTHRYYEPTADEVREVAP